MEIQTAFDALTDLLAEAISAGITSSVTQHDVTRAAARDLRNGAAVQALLGPQLAKLARGLGGEVERKTVVRYAAYLQHPRLGRSPLIDEAEDADTSLNVALQAAQSSSAAAAKIDLALAILRVRAVTQAIGPACIYPPHDAAMPGRTGPRQRRREITAADVPDAVADILLRPVDSPEAQASVVAALKALEQGEHNRGGVVTKSLVLLDRPDGYVALNSVAERIRRARFERDLDAAGEGPSGHVPVPRTAAPAMGSVFRTDQGSGAGSPVSPATGMTHPAPPTPLSLPSESGSPLASARQSASAQNDSPVVRPPTAPPKPRVAQHGSRIPSARDRLAQAHAARRERSQ